MNEFDRIVSDFARNVGNYADISRKELMYKQHTNCRVCGSDKLTEYLDLGMMPLSNNLLSMPTDYPNRYPLKVLFCEECSLSQLSIVIDPETLFGHYVYRSSISQGYKDHCSKMAIELKEKYQLNENSFHIDIAGNDGALLSEFKKSINYYKCLNIDPARNLVEHNENNGIRQFTAFWGYEAAKHLINTGWPKADLITATNVFAHVDNVKEFLEACKMVLADTGVIVLEFPYLIDFIEKVEFDTIYFEHLSYFSIRPLTKLCYDAGLHINCITRQDIHGGSVRVEIGKQDLSITDIAIFMDCEYLAGYYSIKQYKDFAYKVSIIIRNFHSRIKALKQQGKTIAGFAASAKGNTLLNCAGITYEEIGYIVDQTPEKIGKYSPGTNILIVDMPYLIKYEPDYLVILSWNFANEIIKKCRDAGYRGKFILPLTFEIIE